MNEEWRPIPGWPEYEAGSLGSIRRVGGEPRKPSPGRFGHLGLVLYRDGEKPKKQWVHRLVCAAFHGEPPRSDMQAAHRNGNPKDNRPENLRWATPVENAADKKAHGTENFGSRNGRSVLTDAEVSEIRALAAGLPKSSGGVRLRKGSIDPIAQRYGVTKACIAQIIHGHRWPNTKQAEKA
ncbi:NUMOD4 motif-containing HNH endonuclease [Azospirillum sp. A1-3]|uniref:HNH endonuclease n=1 Tax=Azospirillum sp. A1-3 TaxID=185874 RepID=UPI0020773C39|nr:HNH endonuclease [Azospirillum sp. A1-3]MCM8734623.1 NUMOD4 motif-containing HNH endonuclease [Azospirillum sp. A1-3]